MPKIKTHKGTQKRFRLTSSGKVMHRRAYRSHLLEHKSSKRKRMYRHAQQVAPADARQVIRRAPYL